MRVSDQEYIIFELVDDGGGRDCHLVASIGIERWIVVLHVCCGVKLHARRHTASFLLMIIFLAIAILSGAPYLAEVSLSCWTALMLRRSI